MVASDFQIDFFSREHYWERSKQTVRLERFIADKALAMQGDPGTIWHCIQTLEFQQFRAQSQKSVLSNVEGGPKPIKY